MNHDIEIDKAEIDAFYRRIACNVAKMRKEKGLSQLDLSLALGYKSVSLVAGAESGYNNIHFNLEHLFKIAKVLEIDIKDLL